MTDHPSTYKAVETHEEGVQWDDRAAIHAADDGEGLLDGAKGLRDGTLAEMVAHQPHELVEHAVGGRFVEIARRLVGEHEQGAVRKPARDRDALLLAAR